MTISTPTDNHKYRKNVTTDKKYILWKMGLRFWNPKLNHMFDKKCLIKNPLELRGQWGHSGTNISGWIKLYASMS